MKNNYILLSVMMLILGLVFAVFAVLMNLYSQGFWFGFAIASLFPIWLAVAGYRKAKKGFSSKDLRNISRNTRNLGLYISLAIGISAVIEIAGLDELVFGFIGDSALFGALVGLLVPLGVLGIIDSYWLHFVFLWNIPDQRVQGAIKRKS